MKKPCNNGLFDGNKIIRVHLLDFHKAKFDKPCTIFGFSVIKFFNFHCPGFDILVTIVLFDILVTIFGYRSIFWSPFYSFI